MPITPREDLIANFETGDTPTGAQFEQLIQTMYDLAQQSQDAADAATTTADGVQERAARVYGAVTLARNLSAAMTATAIHLYGCTIGFARVNGAGNSETGTLTITFDVAFVSAAYVCVAFVSNSTTGEVHHAKMTRAAGNVVFVFEAMTNVAQSFELHFVIHRTA